MTGGTPVTHHVINFAGGNVGPLYIFCNAAMFYPSGDKAQGARKDVSIYSIEGKYVWVLILLTKSDFSIDTLWEN